MGYIGKWTTSVFQWVLCYEGRHEQKEACENHNLIRNYLRYIST